MKGVKDLALKNRLVKKAGKALAAPASLYYKNKVKHSKKRADQEVDTIRKARGMKNAPDFDSKGRPTDALKYRTAVGAIKQRLNK